MRKIPIEFQNEWYSVGVDRRICNEKMHTSQTLATLFAEYFGFRIYIRLGSSQLKIHSIVVL